MVRGQVSFGEGGKPAPDHRMKWPTCPECDAALNLATQPEVGQVALASCVCGGIWLLGNNVKVEVEAGTEPEDRYPRGTPESGGTGRGIHSPRPSRGRSVGATRPPPAARERVPPSPVSRSRDVKPVRGKPGRSDTTVRMAQPSPAVPAKPRIVTSEKMALHRDLARLRALFDGAGPNSENEGK